VVVVAEVQMVTRFVAVAATAVGLNPKNIEQTKIAAPRVGKLLVFMTFTPGERSDFILSRLSYICSLGDHAEWFVQPQLEGS
jgi:hypothetical protein